MRPSWSLSMPSLHCVWPIGILPAASTPTDEPSKPAPPAPVVPPPPPAPLGFPAVPPSPRCEAAPPSWQPAITASIKAPESAGLNDGQISFFIGAPLRAASTSAFETTNLSGPGYTLDLPAAGRLGIC
jgi:hypothetical protein